MARFLNRFVRAPGRRGAAGRRRVPAAAARCGCGDDRGRWWRVSRRTGPRRRSPSRSAPPRSVPASRWSRAWPRPTASSTARRARPTAAATPSESAWGFPIARRTRNHAHPRCDRRPRPCTILTTMTTTGRRRRRRLGRGAGVAAAAADQSGRRGNRASPVHRLPRERDAGGRRRRSRWSWSAR